MSIKLFFHISKEFFDKMYSPGFENEEDNSSIGYEEKGDEEKGDEEKGDEEKGFEKWFENKNEELCLCNLLLIITQILSMFEFKKQIKNE